MSEPVDWELAERVAIRVAARLPVPSSHHLPDAADLAPIVELAERLVSQLTGLHPPSPAQVALVDRPGWIRANLASFRTLLAEVPAPRLGRRMAAVELGSLLGWMSGRVLGQYDVLTASTSEAVQLVGPNLALLEERHRFDPGQFRLWVTVHELAHRAQFEGVPWMAQHYDQLVRGLVHDLVPSPGDALASLRTMLRRPLTMGERLREGGLATLVATEEQRARLRSAGALMSLLEGHGELVMNRVGPEHLPDAPWFDTVLKARRATLHPVTKFVLRLAGVEAKMRQYDRGATFIEEIERLAGPGAIEVCWRSPEHLPDWAELDEPARWLDRVGVVRV